MNRRNKALVTKAQAIVRKLAKKYGVKEVLVNIQESPIRDNGYALYIDGDIVDLYWNNDGFGWSFNNELIDSFREAGLFMEPYTSTIWDIYKDN